MVALSTTQYIMRIEGLKYTLWLKGVIRELGKDYVTIHCDNQSTIHLVDNHIYHKRTKHINVRLHFMRDDVDFKEVKIKKITS